MKCDADHAKISVINVPLDHPAAAAVINEPRVGVVAPIGCHDIGVFVELKIAAGACLTEGQLWDISDLENPIVTDRIINPLVNIWHSASFTWDAKLVIFGDEEGGAALTHGCTPPREPPGAMWFHERANPAIPVGFFALPRSQGPEGQLTCTAHNYNVIPVTDRYVLTSAFYQGGTSVIDFTNPANAQEVGYFDASGADGKGQNDAWSSYWYKGEIYANDIERRVDLFEFLGEEEAGGRSLHHLNPQTQEELLTGPKRRGR